MKILNFSALNAIETIKIYSRRELSKDSEFSILPYTQNRKLGNLGKCSFTSNFDSSCNLRFRNDKNELRQKLKVIKWIK